MSILQSGSITPGHTLQWVTDGVVKDAGGIPGYQRILGSLIGADFSSIADQPIIIPTNISAFALIGFIVTNSIYSLTTAQGGFYSQASKGGIQLVSSTQVYSFVTGPTVLFYPHIEDAGTYTRWTIGNLPDWRIYLSLTVGQAVIPSLADVYVIGLDISV